jgi:hypothetical protein
MSAMAYLRCPDCRLTVHATAYFMHGDRCPRCLTTMEPAERFRDAPAEPSMAVVAGSQSAAAPDSRRSVR